MSRRISDAGQSVQTLVKSVVLAVHRQDQRAVAPRGFGDDPAGHDQHFLVGERDRLLVLDRGKHSLQAIRPGRSAQHDVDIGSRGHGDQALASRSADGHARGQAGAQSIDGAAGGHRDNGGTVPRDLLAQQLRVFARRERGNR